MKNEKNPKYDRLEANEPPRKEKKKRKKRGGALFLIILLIIIAVLVLLFFNPFGWGGGGAFGMGGQGSSNNSSDNSSFVSDNSDTTSSADTVTITIDNEDIYFDGELCSESVLRDKIIALGTEKNYELEHSRAIKSAYDSVKAILAELEDALGITVNYNE